MSISLTSETGPFIWILFFSSMKIDSFPSSNSMSVFSFVKPFIFPATAAAQAAVPQAFVNPAPLSHTLTLIKFLLITLASVTLHFSGKSLLFSIAGPISLILKLLIFSTKKTTWGFPTLIAVPPICSFLFSSKILIPKFFVFLFSLIGISSHLIFGTPIWVSTKLLFNIIDFNVAEEVQTLISFL